MPFRILRHVNVGELWPTNCIKLADRLCLHSAAGAREWPLGMGKAEFCSRCMKMNPMLLGFVDDKAP